MPITATLPSSSLPTSHNASYLCLLSKNSLHQPPLLHARLFCLFSFSTCINPHTPVLSLLLLLLLIMPCFHLISLLSLSPILTHAHSLTRSFPAFDHPVLLLVTHTSSNPGQNYPDNFVVWLDILVSPLLPVSTNNP